MSKRKDEQDDVLVHKDESSVTPPLLQKEEQSSQPKELKKEEATFSFKKFLQVSGYPIHPYTEAYLVEKTKGVRQTEAAWMSYLSNIRS